MGGLILSLCTGIKYFTFHVTDLFHGPMRGRWGTILTPLTSLSLVEECTSSLEYWKEVRRTGAVIALDHVDVFGRG